MIKNIFSYGFVEGIAKGLNKLIIIALPLFIDTISYGKIGLLLSIEIILPLISLAGFDRAALRFHSERKNFPGFVKTIFSSVLWIHLFIFFMLTCIYILGYKKILGLDIFPDLVLIVMLVYFQGTNLITLNMLRVSENHKKYFQARLFIQVFRIILILAIVYYTQSYLGYLIGGILTAFIANLLFTAKESTPRSENFNKETFTKIFVFSWPFIFHSISGSLLGNADKFVLAKYMSLDEVGLYTLAYSIGSAVAFAYIGITIYLEPIIYKESNSQKRDDILNIFLFFSLCSGLLTYLVISIFSEYLLQYIYDAKYANVSQYAPLIAACHLTIPFYLKSNYKMIYEKKTLSIATVSVICAGTNIILNIILIPVFGLLAAVYTTVIAYILQAVFFVLMANRFKATSELYEVISFSTLLFIGIYFAIPFYYMSLIILAFMAYMFARKFQYRPGRLYFDIR